VSAQNLEKNMEATSMDEGLYVYYHPLHNEMFLLPISPSAEQIDSPLDVEMQGEQILTGIFYVGEF